VSRAQWPAEEPTKTARMQPLALQLTLNLSIQETVEDSYKETLDKRDILLICHKCLLTLAFFLSLHNSYRERKLRKRLILDGWSSWILKVPDNGQHSMAYYEIIKCNTACICLENVEVGITNF
jgi:hypothetical protein